MHLKHHSFPDSVIVIGGGIAGVTAAHALAARGVAVTLLERRGIGSGASGNQAGVLYPQLAKKPSVTTRWHFTAYDFMLGQLAAWRAQGYGFGGAECGMVRFPRHAVEREQFQRTQEVLGLSDAVLHWQEAEVISARVGMQVADGGLYFPRGSWVAVQELCVALSTHPGITVHQAEVTSLARVGDAWEVRTGNSAVFAAPQVIVAAAHEASALLPDHAWRLHAVGGQVSLLAASQVAVPLSEILCLSGYIVPLGDGYLIGATYNHGPDALAVTEENHTKNLADVARLLPGWVQGAPVSGRTAYRATTPDRLPYVGEVAAGLWVTVGHGSRGLLSAPLAAEVIAAGMGGDAFFGGKELVQAVRPRRFG